MALSISTVSIVSEKSSIENGTMTLIIMTLGIIS
jgi:hypothetical protein